MEETEISGLAGDQQTFFCGNVTGKRILQVCVCACVSLSVCPSMCMCMFVCVCLCVCNTASGITENQLKTKSLLFTDHISVCETDQ